jgi:hypothetical protein
MDRRGELANFLVCKVGIALAAAVLLGAAFSMSSSSKYHAEREELTTVADTIADAIRTAESLPCKVELLRELPVLPQRMEVKIIGTRGGEVQVIHITVEADGQVERILLLEDEVNGGEFTLSRENPNAIRVEKGDKVWLELV